MSTIFGKTDVSEKELKEGIAYDKAVAFLDGAVRCPDYRLNLLVHKMSTHIPELEERGRVFPWRKTDSEYKIYISEILLRRTRGEAVAKIYPEFFEKFPDPQSLHNSKREEIEKTIRPLGLENRRSRSIVEAAEVMVENQGRVPSDREHLEEPFGVGRYAAGATLLFAFNISTELIDSNVVGAVSPILDYKPVQRPSKSEKYRQLMRFLTPENPRVARSFYFTMIDFDIVSN